MILIGNRRLKAQSVAHFQKFMRSNNQDLYVRLGRVLKCREQFEKRARDADFYSDQWFWRIILLLATSVSLMLVLIVLGLVTKTIGGNFSTFGQWLFYPALLFFVVIALTPFMILGLEITRFIKRMCKPLNEKLLEDANDTDWLWRGGRCLMKFSKVQLIQTKDRLETKLKDLESLNSSAVSFYQFSPVVITAVVVSVTLAVIPDSVLVESFKQQNIFDGTKVVSGYIVNMVSFDVVKMIIALYLILPAHIPLINAVNYRRTKRLKNSIALLQQAITGKDE